MLPPSPREEGNGHAGALVGRRRLAGAFMVEVSRIRPDPAQPRRELNSDAQRELIASIEQLGVLQPIAVRFLEAENIYQIISGERRFQAAKKAGLAEIPCWVQSPREEQILVRQIVENWQRSDLSAFELADALGTIRDAHDYSQQELARLTGKPKSEISRLLALLEMDPKAQQEARVSEAFGKRQLYAIARTDPKAQVDLVRQVKEQGLTAVETEKLAKQSLPSPTGRRPSGAPTTYRRFTTLHAAVSLTFRKRRVEDADVLRALEEVRGQLKRARPAGNRDAASPS